MIAAGFPVIFVRLFFFIKLPMSGGMVSCQVPSPWRMGSDSSFCNCLLLLLWESVCLTEAEKNWVVPWYFWLLAPLSMPCKTCCSHVRNMLQVTIWSSQQIQILQSAKPNGWHFLKWVWEFYLSQSPKTPFSIVALLHGKFL